MSFASSQLDFFDALGTKSVSVGVPGLWIGAPVRAALDEVMLAIEQGASMIVVGGGAGSGKTVLAELIVRRCAEIGRPACPIVRGDLVQSGIPRDCDVIVVDEADSIAELDLKAIQPADGCEQPKRCYVFLCLPSSVHRFTFANPAIIALRALSPFEAMEYLTEFSSRNGRADLFAPEALDTIVGETRGLPRLLDKVASFAQFLATSEGQARIGLKHVTIALQSQMVGSQGFDALPAPEPAIASDSISIQTTDADGVLAEIQGLRDGSIGDVGRTERPEGDAGSLAPAIAVSAIAPVISRGELAAVCIAALVVSVAALIAVPGLRTRGADDPAAEHTLSLAPIFPAVLGSEQAPPPARQASLVARVIPVPRTPLVASTADSEGTASLPPDGDGAQLTSDNSTPPPPALSPKKRGHAATKMPGRKPNLSAAARRDLAQEHAEAARRAAERVAQAAEQARVAKEQARRAQEAARLAVARARAADEAAERGRAPAASAGRIGRSLRTFFSWPIDSMKLIARSLFERAKPATFVNDEPD